ncbi:hypothetical protein [Levilactobacillus bambusae]|uniref:Uncharacterized protein n=1 Tax=Levilactobacillus bambusae TaxID=2024736 RepID=A0A2V1N0M8_9LACO|nr:hypothetical protein [Levilactobacillus bambusae]PWF99925.1 hypothetical protein DCM90_02940 [Levilactobacillus bambusae]
MTKQNKLLDDAIRQRFDQEKDYQAVRPSHKKRTRLEVAIGIIMFLILISNLIIMLINYL